MKPKVTYLPYGNKKLYFCPNCKTGHLIEPGTKKCDICGVDLEWDDKEAKQCTTSCTTSHQ